MEFKDYYKIMGVPETATPEEIKTAYRKLARKYHPDVSKESNAEAKFKELGEANEVLKDQEKRAAYDKLRKGGWRSGEEFRTPPGWEFQGGFGGEEFGGGGAEQFSDFFESLFGRGGFGQAGGRQRRGFRARGEDLSYAMQITLEEVYHGGTRTIQLRVPEVDAQGRMLEKTHTLNVKIPAGVTQGQKIRLAGQGGPGQGGGPNGDLYLEIQLEPHRLYHVDGRDITISLPITPWEAALGASIEVPTLGGKIAVKIPANSQTGNKLRLKGRGLPGKPAGDQYVILQIFTPKADTETAKKLYQEMAENMPFNPRATLGI